MDVKVEGQRELKAAMEKATEQVGASAMKAMQSVGLSIIAEAKSNLNANKTNNTGVLRASGKVQKGEDEGTIDAGFFSSSGKDGYAAAVEYGRGPSKRRGTIPLEDSLKAWVHRKLGVPYGKELDSAAFLIARKIHRKGTKAQPFFAPAVKKFENQIAQIMDKKIKEEIK